MASFSCKATAMIRCSRSTTCARFRPTKRRPRSAPALVVGSGAEALVAARGHGRAVDALPRAADAGLLPEALRTLPPRPIYGRAPDARPMT